MNDDGLVFALGGAADTPPLPLDWAGLRAWTPEAGFLWLHLDLEEEGARRWLEEESGLDPVVVQALAAEETRPRSAVFGDGLVLLLRGINHNPGAEPDDMVALRVWAEPARVVTLRRRRLREVETVQGQAERGELAWGAGSLLATLSDALATGIGEAVEDVEDQADDLEDQVLVAESRELRARISEIRRAIIGLRRYLAPQREALGRLSAERLTWLDDGQRMRLREVGDRMLRFVEELDAAREHAGVAHEELSGRLTERVERRMYVLSLVAAIFLPLSFLTGLLGINVGGIPGAEEPLAFAVVVGLCLAVAAGLLFLLKRRGWF